jgi:hypothetical protein
MPSNIQCAAGSTPMAEPYEISASSPQDVWFTYSLENTGDTDDNTTGFYFQGLASNGATVVNDYAPYEELPAGGAIEQGYRIEAASFSGVQGDVWVTLYDPQANQLGAARITVNP